MKIKQDKYDKTFSQFIKYRDTCCQKCGKSVGKLECSHIFSRRHKALRHDPRNAKLLCFPCHRWWHENPPEAIEWLIGVIGEASYDKLRFLAYKPTKMSKFDMDIQRKYLQDEMKKPQKCFNPQWRNLQRELMQ